jgi:hypothetical protein
MHMANELLSVTVATGTLAIAAGTGFCRKRLRTLRFGKMGFANRGFYRNRFWDNTGYLRGYKIY